MSDHIDEQAVGQHYGDWFTTGLRGVAMRYIFSRRGLWVINTPYRRILHAAGIKADDRVLDLGCGIGNILIALCQRIDFNLAPLGVDVSPDLIELGRREVRTAGFQGKIDLQIAPATRLPFADHAFDVVLTSHVIKHLDDAALGSAFGEVFRVLRPGGRFLIWEFKRSPFSAPLFISARLTGLPPPFKLRDSKTIAACLQSAGFQKVATVPTGIFLAPPVPRLAMLATR